MAAESADFDQSFPSFVSGPVLALNLEPYVTDEVSGVFRDRITHT